MGQKRKQPKPDTQLNITSEVTEDHYRIKNWVAREWLPIIGTQATMLYNIYSAAANKERGNSWFFSIRTLEEFTFIDKSTINMANWLLELCGLIRVDAGADGYANEYVILDPPHVTAETLKPIVATLKEPADVGEKWRLFKANVLDRINRWKPLHECGKISQYKKGLLESQVKAGQLGLFTNGNGHHAATDLPSHAELVANLMQYFEPEKLSEAAAVKMITDYGIEAVAMQLSWLPDRESDTPLRTLRAALKGQWAEPKPVGKAQGKSWLSPEEKEAILKRQEQFEEVV